MKRWIILIGLAIILMLTACTPGESDEPVGLPNPASVFCEEQGGVLEIRESASGQYGVCIFEDGTECEEWAFFRGECKPGDLEEAPVPEA